ncbi:MAG TPA: MBL fold metallo-hydrolase [Syntrophomonadaceae bacterium]|nr:MBL fold metallo-hydrolase [Syntrophomonadaceae bacterium]
MKKVANRIYLISPEQAPVYPYSNSLWIDDDKSTIIDFGAGISAYKDIDKERVVYGLFSHAHFDHMHCNTLFTNAKFMAAEDELLVYSKENAYEKFFGYDVWNKIMPEYIPRPSFGAIRPANNNEVSISPGFRYIEIARPLRDNDIISTGHTNIHAIHLPGHSIGHFGFYFEKENILFSGDLDLVSSGPLYNNSTSNIGSLISSINRIRDINPSIIISSHRRIQNSNIQLKLERYIKVVLEREEFLYNYLSVPRSTNDLYSLSFWKIKDVYDVFWNRMTINNHLRYMLEKKIIISLNDGYFIRI